MNFDDCVKYFTDNGRKVWGWVWADIKWIKFSVQKSSFLPFIDNDNGPHNLYPVVWSSDRTLSCAVYRLKGKVKLAQYLLLDWLSCLYTQYHVLSFLRCAELFAVKFICIGNSTSSSSGVYGTSSNESHDEPEQRAPKSLSFLLSSSSTSAEGTREEEARRRGPTGGKFSSETLCLWLLWWRALLPNDFLIVHDLPQYRFFFLVCLSALSEMLFLAMKRKFRLLTCWAVCAMYMRGFWRLSRRRERKISSTFVVSCDEIWNFYGLRWHFAVDSRKFHRHQIITASLITREEICKNNLKLLSVEWRSLYNENALSTLSGSTSLAAFRLR